jgi:hypothetical protein
MVIDEIVRLIEWYEGRVPDVGHSTRASPSLAFDCQYKLSMTIRLLLAHSRLGAS